MIDDALRHAAFDRGMNVSLLQEAHLGQHVYICTSVVCRYWPVIDDALRRAAFDRGVNVSLLISYWKHTWQDMQRYLKSLSEMRYHSFYKNDNSININVVSLYLTVSNVY